MLDHKEINGAIGIEQIKKFEKMINVRKRNAKLFTNLFKNDDRFIIQKETGSSSWFAFTLIANPKKINKLKIFKIFKKNKIDFRMITGGNIASHDVIKYLNITKADLNLPNANYVHKNGFSLAIIQE